MTTQTLLQMPAGRALAARLVKTYYVDVGQAAGILLLVGVVMTAILQTIEIGVLIATGSHGPFQLRLGGMISPQTMGLGLGMLLLVFITVPAMIYIAGLFFKASSLLTSSETS